MDMEVKLFGSLSEMFGKSILKVNDCYDIKTLKENLFMEYPELKNCVFLISVDKKVVLNNQKLEAENEIAFLPPFAGG